MDGTQEGTRHQSTQTVSVQVQVGRDMLVTVQVTLAVVMPLRTSSVYITVVTTDETLDSSQGGICGRNQWGEFDFAR